MSTHAMALVAQLRNDDDGLTLRELIADIPHDPGMIFVYVLVVGSLLFVWWAHRNARAR